MPLVLNFPAGPPPLTNSKCEGEGFSFFAGEEPTQITLYFILSTYRRSCDGVVAALEVHRKVYLLIIYSYTQVCGYQHPEGEGQNSLTLYHFSQVKGAFWAV